jgi:hypothetical protein
MPTSTELVFSKVRSNDLQSPEAAASQPTYSSSVCLPSNCWILCLISALLLIVQASVCAMIFEFGHELGRYAALLHALRTVTCGSLRMGVADARTAARRASAGVPARSRPARVRPTGRHGVVCRRSAGAVRLRLRPGYVMDRLLSWSSLYITLFKCLYFYFPPTQLVASTL